MKNTWMLMSVLALMALGACDTKEPPATSETEGPDTLDTRDPDTLQTTPPRMAACCNNEPDSPGPTGPADEGMDGGYANADMAVLADKTGVKDEGAQWHLYAYIYNEAGDDCSAEQCTRAIILLPAFSVVDRVVAIGAGGTPLSWTQCMARIEVQLSWLCPGKEGDHIDVWVNKSTFDKAKCSPSFGVFVYSSLADLWPNNNYWWWYDRCDGTSGKPLPPVWGPRS